MAISRTPRFPHRHNEDGSWDSICPKCFLTVAREELETELEAEEKAHICKGLDLKKIFAP
jgi:hypothetical protein